MRIFFSLSIIPWRSRQLRILCYFSLLSSIYGTDTLQFNHYAHWKMSALLIIHFEIHVLISFEIFFLIHGLIRNVLFAFKESRGFPVFLLLLISLIPLYLENAFCKISTSYVVEDCSMVGYMVYLGVLCRHLKRQAPYLPILHMCKSNSRFNKYKH